MKKTLILAGFAGLLSTSAMAETVGVSMALFDDNFLTVLRNGMQEHAATLDGVTLQIEDAQNDVGKQLNQIQNFVASGVDAIIVNPVDTDATVAMSQAAGEKLQSWHDASLGLFALSRVTGLPELMPASAPKRPPETGPASTSNGAVQPH